MRDHVRFCKTAMFAHEYCVDSDICETSEQRWKLATSGKCFFSFFFLRDCARFQKRSLAPSLVRFLGRARRSRDGLVESCFCRRHCRNCGGSAQRGRGFSLEGGGVWSLIT